jgi:hypothetical protein
VRTVTWSYDIEDQLLGVEDPDSDHDVGQGYRGIPEGDMPNCRRGLRALGKLFPALNKYDTGEDSEPTRSPTSA